jgi:hypothetical protein
MTGTNFSTGKSSHDYPRSLPVSEWPEADRRAWEAACQPGSRLQPGGVASYLAEVSRDDFARRYGAFLGFLQRSARLDRGAAAAAQVTSPSVEAYIADLNARVRSVTVWNCIYKLRRAAELLAPSADFSWLAEIEKNLALVMEPRSKFDRLVFTERLVEAGLTLVTEAERFANNDLARARGVRNGLMITLLALCPIRLKNFAALEMGQTFKEIHGRWWVALPCINTKSRRRDERRVPSVLNRYIDAYLHQSRPVLYQIPLIRTRGPIGAVRWT